MQYGKLTNGVFEPFTGSYIRHNGRIYVNPKEATLIKLGYKPLMEAEPIEECEEYYISEVYTETETDIVKSYEYIKMPNNAAEKEETE